MHFVKAHAYGNDFLYVENRAVRGIAVSAAAHDLCDRHTGIGADGLILFTKTPDAVAMTLFNADGSPAEVSGNGVRGLAALLLRHDDRNSAELTIQTDAGPKRLTRTGRWKSRQTFRAAKGLPKDVRELSLSVGGEPLTAVAMDFGNPQCVVLGPLPDDDRFRRLGAGLAQHQMFHEGTNVEFAEIRAYNHLQIRIWERGVGPTSSSGTGSCAALVAAASFAGLSRDADVAAPGGAQRVEWRDDSVYLTGWAEVVADGVWLAPVARQAETAN